jgi:hypothetical protein
LSVWRSVTATVLSRKQLRRDAVFRLRVERDEQVPPEMVILEIDFEYTLLNLTDKVVQVAIEHQLDAHIRTEDSSLPRFVSAGVGTHINAIEANDNWVSADGAMTVKDGCLFFKVALAAGGIDPPRIHVRRREIRQCPGVYYLITDELIDGLRVQLDHTIKDVQVFVTIRPDKADIPLNKVHVVADDEPLLPGHGVEFEFRPQLNA